MKAFDDFLLWQEVVYYVVANALGYSHYYIVAVIIIVLLTSKLVYGQTDGRTEPAYKISRLHRCKKSKKEKTSGAPFTIISEGI